MGEVSKKYMQECESLKTQLSQKEKAYVTLMDQFNKLQAEKNGLQELIKGQADDISTLRERLESKTAEIDSIQAVNADYIKVIHNWERKASEYEQKIDSLQEQCKVRYEAIEKLNAEKAQLKDVIADRTKDVQYYDVENKKFTEMLTISEKARENAEKELKKAKKCLEFEINEKARVDRMYDEIKIKNANICSTIADMVRKVMQE